MARYRSLALALLLLICCVTAVSAQMLQRLTVTQLTLAASTSTPQVEVPFDLIVTAKVQEHVMRLENLDLPILAEVELLGDEHSVVSVAAGSTYTERIRVVAHHSGAVTIAPVTLDAIDARDGKPKRYSSNALTLNVRGVGLGGPPSSTFDVVGALIAFVRWVVAIGIVVLVFAIIYVRRRRGVPAAAPVVLPPPTPVETPPDPRDRLRQQLELLRTSATRGNVMRVRHVAREMVGASDAETLDDVLRRTPTGDIRMRSLLRSLERAAFTHDADFASALSDVVQRLEEMT